MGILIKGGSEIFLNSVNKGLNKRGGGVGIQSLNGKIYFD